MTDTLTVTVDSLLERILSTQGNQLTDIIRAWSVGDFPLSSRSTAYEAVRLVKSYRGTLFGFSVYNSNAATQFVQVHNLTGTPTNQAIPNVVFAVPGSLSLGVNFGAWGRRFSRGIVIVNSTTGPTYTAGAADCYIDAQYV